MKTKFLIAVSLIVLVSSCMKDVESLPSTPNNTNSNVKATKMSEIKVPEGFKWQLSKEVDVNVSVNDNSSIQIIRIYNQNPADGGKLIATGAATSNKPFLAKISVSNTISNLYIQKTGLDNGKTAIVTPISGAIVNVAFNSNNTQKMGKTGSPDCSIGCNTTVNNPSGNLTYNAGNTVCLTGNINIGNLTIGNNTTVRICGTGSINNLNFSNTNAQLTITSTGNINFTSTTPIDGIFTNYGTVTTSSNRNFNVNSNAIFTNNGVAHFGKDFNPNGQSVVVNNGSIEVDEKLINSSGCNFTNNCKLIVHNDFQNNGLFKNYGYVKCDEETTIQGGTNNQFEQYNGAMISTKNIQVNGTITGIGITSLIKVSAQSKGNSQGLVNGNQNYCDANGIEGPWNASISGGASQSCGLLIATNACNPEGNGNTSTPPADTDGDGVPDSTDEYPNDPNAAFNSYYPSKDGISTVAYEDLWPYKGDYDLNDVVVTYNYKIVTNASNVVVKVNGTYTLHATGGGYNNGFAVQFPINRNTVSNVTGATLEAGQSKAVLVLFSNMRNEMSQWNTVNGSAKSNAVNYSMSYNITSGPTLANFGLNEYNPFIWNGTAGFGRGYEIHLPYKQPTDLANSSLFSTGDDNTNLGMNRQYVSKNGGYPWAINIPVKFDYPTERSDINTAYNNFAAWVQSNGTQFNDWYTSNPGNRNTANIFN